MIFEAQTHQPMPLIPVHPTLSAGRSRRRERRRARRLRGFRAGAPTFGHRSGRGGREAGVPGVLAQGLPSLGEV